jgi:hypothetical protein
MQHYDLLMQAADLLEKTAAHIEEAEGAAYRIVTEHQTAAANKIASQLTSLVGSPVAAQTVTKMAGLGPEVNDILQKLAGVEAVENMGGPATVEKTANARGEDNGSSLIDWILS